MPKTIRVATTQYTVGDDMALNLSSILDRIDQAAANGADLVLFPEFGNHSALYRDKEHCWEVAVAPDDDWVGAIRQRAADQKIWVLFNATTRGDYPNVYLQNYLINRQGEIVGTARKQVLIYVENDFITPSSDEATVFDTELGRIGLYSCMDGVVPETAHNLALRGAQILLNSLSSNARDEGAVHVPTRAAENGVWVINSCKSGPLAPEDETAFAIMDAMGMAQHLWHAPGESQVVAPDGRVLAKGGYDTDEIVYADITPGRADDKRIPGVGDLHADRRPDAYGVLVLPNDQLPVVTNPSRQPVGAVKVAVVQPDPTLTPDLVLLRAIDMIHEAADGDARLVVLPELFPFAPGQVAAGPADAAATSAEIAARLARIAADRGLHIATSLVEREGDRFYHSVSLWTPSGDHRYRQVHLREPDRAWATPGDRFETFDTDLGRIGLLAGYDGLFPESARILACLGADLILYPTTWMVEWEPDLTFQERAAENHLVIVAAARADSPVRAGSLIATVPRQPAAFRGKLNPVYLTAAPAAREALLFQTIEPELSRVKLMMPKTDAILNRRAELYRPLVEPAVR